MLASGWQQNTVYDDPNRRLITKKDTGTAGAGDNVSVANFDQLGRLRLTQLLDQGSLNAGDITTGTKQQTRYRYSGNNSYQLASNLYGEATSQSSGSCGNVCVIGWTVTKFDQNGRPISGTTYDGSALPAPWGSNTSITGTTTTAYSGKNVTVTEQAGKVQHRTMDALGRLVGIVDDSGTLNYSVSYAYDALDNLVGVSQSGQSRTFVYDSLARLTSATNPESGIVAYTYDVNGNLLSKLDGLSVTTSYAYDALNRMVSKTYSGSTAAVTPNVTYTYCNSSSCGVTYGVGRLKTVSTSQGNATNYTAYNSVGAVLASNQTIGSKNYPFTYSRTLSGSLSQELYPSDRQMNYGYSYAERPQSISGSKTTGGVTTNTTYVNWMGWAASTEISRSLGALGALITDLRFNARGELTEFNTLDWNHADNSPYYVHWQWFYNYGGSNNNGNLLSVTEHNSPSLNSAPSSSASPAVTTYFGYDGVNRLISANDNSYTRSMCYDAYGNGWVTGYAGTPSLPGNAPREIGGACPAGSGATPYATATNRLVGNTYDADGNQTVIGGNTVNYDAEGRVVSVVSGSTTLVSYQYDGDGRRVQKTAQSGTTNFVYDAGGALMAEYLGAAISKEYVRFHSSYIPSNVDLVAIENASGNGAPCSPCFIIPDLLGNVRMVADNAGHAASRHDYLPFGEEALADPNRPAAGGFGLTDSVKQRFTGKERDAETSLDYFGARYYGAALGRWTSPDALNLTSARLFNPTNTLNKYIYGGNNPLKYIDPDGEDITIYYRPAQGGSNADFGHIFIGALNQDSGKVGFLDYYPNGTTDGLGRGPGAFNLGNMQDRAGQIDKYASLTIQTSPAQAQKVLDLIDKLKSGAAPDYKALSNNCTTVCEDVLHDLGLDFGDVTPYQFWADAYRKFGANQQLGTYNARWPQVIVPTTPGQQYGNPRNFGPGNFDLFNLYLNQLQNPQPKACVSTYDSASGSYSQTCQ